MLRYSLHKHNGTTLAACEHSESFEHENFNFPSATVSQLSSVAASESFCIKYQSIIIIRCRTHGSPCANLNTPAQTRVCELFPSGTLSDLSQGCIPRNCVIVFTASSSVFIDDSANVSSSSFSAPCVL